VIYLAIVLSSLHLILEIQVGASGDCVDGFEGWEIGVLLRRFLIWGGEGGLFDSIFGWIAWVFVAGYVICRGVEG
jgi:hypothetical protein